MKFPGCSNCKHSVPSCEAPWSKHKIGLGYYKMYCPAKDIVMNDESEDGPANVTACEQFHDKWDAWVAERVW